MTFAVVALAMVATPGVGTLLVFRASLAAGFGRGMLTAAGVNAATLLYGVVSGAGLAAVLVSRPALQSTLVTVSSLYLAWVGLSDIWRAIRPPRSTGEDVPAAVGFAGGFTGNLLNPGLMTMYGVIVPGFIEPAAGVFLSTLRLTAIHLALSICFHTGWAVVAARLGRAAAWRDRERWVRLAAGVALLMVAARRWR